MGKQIKQEKPKLQILHESLLRDNYDVPTDYASFERNLSDEKKSQTLYGKLREDQYDVPGEYDSFAKNLEIGSYTSKKKDLTGSEDLSTTGPVQSPEVEQNILSASSGAHKGLAAAIDPLKRQNMPDGPLNVESKVEPIDIPPSAS